MISGSLQATLAESGAAKLLLEPGKAQREAGGPVV